jgi:flagellar basal body-associated protein FliL
VKEKVNTKKIVFIIGGVIGTIVLLIAIFVGAIVGITFYSIGNSEAAQTAKQFLKKNETLKKDIGEVKDFGTFITGNIKTRNNDGIAALNLKVIGEKKTVSANVSLMYRDGSSWRVTAASYKNDEGKTIDLLKVYEDDSP